MEGGEKYLLHKCSSSLADMASYLKTPIATYTHTSNKEILVSAVDVPTSTFTSVAHGLANNNCLFPVMAYGTANCYLKDKLPGGISTMNHPGYYVKVLTADTFQLYSDSGLTTLVTLSSNANMDLTSFKFVENHSANYMVQISGLPSLQKCRVVVRGRTYRKDNSAAIYPTAIPIGGIWFAKDSTVYTNWPGANCAGDQGCYIEVLIDTTKYVQMQYNGMCVAANTTIANTVTFIDKMYLTSNYKEVAFDSITLNMALANGSVVEVYRA